jgi:hypothetical protein
MGTHHGLRSAILRGDIQVVDTPVAGQLEPLPGRFRRSRPAGRTTEYRHAAHVARATEPAVFHANPALELVPLP